MVCLQSIILLVADDDYDDDFESSRSSEPKAHSAKPPAASSKPKSEDPYEDSFISDHIETKSSRSDGCYYLIALMFHL